MHSNGIIQALHELAKSKQTDDAARAALKEQIIAGVSEDKKTQAATWVDAVFSELDKPFKAGEANLMPLCELIYLFENNGTAKEHAEKLSAVFKDLRGSLKYLAEFQKNNSNTQENSIMYDACLFQLPANINGGTSEIWKNLAEKFMVYEKFRKLFEHAPSIEAKLKEIKSATAVAGVRQPKEIEEALQEEEDECITELVQMVSNLKIELANACGGFCLENLSVNQLDAVYEKYKYDSSDAYKVLVEGGVTQDKIDQFFKLTRQDSDERIPDIVIDGAAIGHPGYYLRKLYVLEDEDAALGVILGRKADCWQSLMDKPPLLFKNDLLLLLQNDFEERDACAIHGLTSLEGGFYVLFSGDASNQKTDDPVVGQTWVWRSQSDAIVFNLIKRADEKMEHIIKDFYENLAIELVNQKYTEKVACGSLSKEISEIVGVNNPFKVDEKYKDYDGYSDSESQRVLVDLNKLYCTYGRSNYCNNKMEEGLRKIFNSEKNPLKSRMLIEAINYGLIKPNLELLNTIDKISKEFGFEVEIKSMTEAMREYINSTTMSSEVLQTLINNKHFPINMFDIDGQTPLMMAAKGGHADVCKALITAGADVNSKDKGGKTSLILAAYPGHADVCKMLINAGAEVHAREAMGGTALEGAAMGGHAELCKSLVKFGADVNVKNAWEQTPLTWSAELGHADACLALIDSGADVSAKDKWGETPLTRAVQRGHADTCKAIIKSGADVNSEVKDGETLLIWAAKAGNADVCEALIEVGANLNTKYGKNNETALLLAAKAGHADACKVLINAGADVDAKDESNGITPLMWLLVRGDADASLALINAGADVNAKDKFDRTPLMLLDGVGHADMRKTLIEAGAKALRAELVNDTELFWEIEKRGPEKMNSQKLLGQYESSKEKNRPTAEAGVREVESLPRHKKPRGQT